MTGRQVPVGFWQPIRIMCMCGRPHGNQHVETWDADAEGRWTGETCGVLAVDAVERGVPAPGLAPGDTAPPSRLRAVDGHLPTWTGTCARCGEHARVRGERLSLILDALAGQALTRMELAAVRRLAARR